MQLSATGRGRSRGIESELLVSAHKMMDNSGESSPKGFQRSLILLAIVAVVVVVVVPIALGRGERTEVHIVG